MNSLLWEKVRPYESVLLFYKSRQNIKIQVRYVGVTVAFHFGSGECFEK